MNDVHKNIRLLAKALRIGGDTHTLDDLLVDLRIGSKQGFVVNDSWVITEITVYPRKKVLTIFLVVGNKEDFPKLYEMLVKFAKEHKLAEIWAFGRPGWKKYADQFGFKPRTTLFVKDMEDERSAKI